MHKYIFFWLDGAKTHAEGISVGDAARNAGIQRGALQAIDFFAEDADDEDYSIFVDKTGKHEWLSQRTIENHEQLFVRVESPAPKATETNWVSNHHYIEK